jgi:hypothetical protein
VERIQDNGVKVIAISGHRSECASQIVSALDHYGISFRESAWPIREGFDGELAPPGANDPIGYEDGIILAAGQDKGKMLKAVLDESGAPMPKLIVMVDYLQKDLGQVMQAFAFSSTRVHAWRYTRIDTDKQSVDTAQN